ncbi:MAG: carbon storage regulator [Phycisphaerae bacterium]|nr:carbon storage regulator [Phycisphaerae bacterium]
MLVLSRKRDESIVIGPCQEGEIIELTIVRIKGETVRLGTTASKGARIFRRELIDKGDDATPQTGS